MRASNYSSCAYILGLIGSLCSFHIIYSSSLDKRPPSFKGKKEYSIDHSSSFRKSKYNPEKRQMRPRATPLGLERMFSFIRQGSPQNALNELDRINLFHSTKSISIPNTTASSTSVSSSMQLSQTHYHELIKELGEQGYLRECDEVLVRMKTQNIRPTVLTFNHLISRSAQWQQTSRAQRYFQDMEKENIRPDVRIYNCLINSYTKNGDLDQAKIILDQMKKNRISPTVVTFNTLIDGVVRLKQKQSNMSKVDQALSILSSMEEHNIKPNVRTYSSLIHVYCDNGMPDKGYELLLQMRDKHGMIPPYVSFSILVHSYGQEGDLSKAFEILHYMKSAGYMPNVTTLSSLIAACGKHRFLNLAFSLYNDMWMSTNAQDLPNAITCSSLIDSCLKQGEVDRALSVLNDMRQHGVALTQITYTSLMCELTKLKRYDLIQELTSDPSGKKNKSDTSQNKEFNTLQNQVNKEANVRDTQVISSSQNPSSQLSSSGYVTPSSSFGRRVMEYEALKREGRAPAPEFFQTLMKTLYSETLQRPPITISPTTTTSGTNTGATTPVLIDSRVTDSLPISVHTDSKTAISSTSTSASGSNTRRTDDLFRLYLVFQEMRGSGVQPDIVAYNMLINAAAGAGALDNVLETVETMQREGISPDVITYTSIIKAAGINGGHGMVSLAEEIFETMQQRTNHFSSYVEPSLLTFERLIQTHLRARTAAPTATTPASLSSSLESNATSGSNCSLPVSSSSSSQHGVNTQRVWELFQDMKFRGIRPNIAIYRYVIKATLLENDISRALTLVNEVRQGESSNSQVTFDPKIWTSVMNACVSNNRTKEADTLWAELNSRGNI